MSSRSRRTRVKRGSSSGTPASRLIAAGDLSRLQLHSARFVVIVLDTDASGEAWRTALEQRQIVALLSVPLDAAQLLEAFANARDECHARSAVLGEDVAAVPAVAATGSQTPRARNRDRRCASASRSRAPTGGIENPPRRSVRRDDPSLRLRRRAGARPRRSGPMHPPTSRSIRFSRRRAKRCSIGTTWSRPAKMRWRCTAAYCSTTPITARHDRVSSGWRRYYSLESSRIWMIEDRYGAAGARNRAQHRPRR